ncbi:MAG: D-alanine--D-alanine ligase A, partial [Clostridiales Family XIII bacterium]|nr:D-alanine--D-alanine ligase A [Clostridiales Family XIII bacterium]
MMNDFLFAGNNTRRQRDRVAVLFGGRSQEHEISVLSAASIIGAIDREKHDVVPVAIAKDGAWYLIDTDMSGLSALNDPLMERLFPNSASEAADATAYPDAHFIDIAAFAASVDFVFPALHGPYGEDGSVQGLFETLSIPYAGCGICASAIAMDKIITKELLARVDIPVLDYLYMTAHEYGLDAPGSLSRIEDALGYPVFVKPA